MKNENRTWSVATVVFLTTALGCTSVQAKGPSFDTAKIEKITGLKGAYTESERTFKVSSPRSDVKVSVDKLPMSPFMGLTSWAAFTPGTDSDLMVMGDLTLFQDEVNPVMSALLDNGLEVTALHNHFFFDDPKVYFMHIGGEGKLEALATGVKKALDAMKAIRKASPSPASSFGGHDMPTTNSITAKPIEGVFGMKAMAQNGMAKIVIGRTVKMPCGCEMGSQMGVNTWAAFAGTDDNAVVDGDIVMFEKEVQPTLKALRKAGINVVALHHHMLEETPRTIFLHYWGRGKASDLAQAVKSAVPTGAQAE
jgi:hypothetical protein